MLGRVIGNLVLLFCVACATTNSSSNKNKQPGPNEYFDGNQAPLAMQPPRDISSATTMIDPLYLSTQADYHFTLGESYSLEGYVDKAIEEFKLVLVYDPNSSKVRSRLATEYVRKGLLSEAMEQAKTAVEMDPQNYEARVLLAGIFASLKIYDSAEKLYRESIKMFPGKIELSLHLGALLAEQHRFTESAAIFNAAARDKSNEQSHLAYYYLGRVWFEAKEYKKSESAFRDALRVNPKFEDGVVALAKLFETQSQRQHAVRLLASYQDKQGPSERVADVLGRYYLEEEEYDKAYKQYEIIEAADGSNLNIKVKMALILIERKHFPQAATKLQQILVQAPESDKIRFYLGAVFEEMKEHDNAIENFMKIPPTSSFYGEAVLHAAYLYKQKGEVDRAIEVVEGGLKENPEAEQFYTLYASLLHEKKEYKKAIAALEIGKKAFPKNDQILFFLGSLYDKDGRRGDTISTMKDVIELNSNHYQALNYLAYTWAEMGENLKEAEKFVKQALSIKGEDPYIQDTLGWVLFKQGRYDEAVKILEVAHRIKPDESIIAEHLGDAYYRAELPEKARAMYRKAAELETDQENIRKINSKISAIDKSSPRRPASESLIFSDSAR